VEDSPSIRSIAERHWLAPSSLPRCLISVLCSRPTLTGRQRGYFVHILDRSGVRSCLSTGGTSSAAEDFTTPVPDHLPFWFKPDSIFGLLLITVFISTSPKLTCPGLLAPDRLDAGSRRVGSRFRDRSFDRGYVVPQASDLTVAGDACWGSRPMAEHRVMSEDLLGITHYRSRRCDESHARNQQVPVRPQCRGVAPLLRIGTPAPPGGKRRQDLSLPPVWRR
jgi:hypothetical protein